jgi:hypothetical protein
MWGEGSARANTKIDAIISAIKPIGKHNPHHHLDLHQLSRKFIIYIYIYILKKKKKKTEVPRNQIDRWFMGMKSGVVNRRESPMGVTPNREGWKEIGRQSDC